MAKTPSFYMALIAVLMLFSCAPSDQQEQKRTVAEYEQSSMSSGAIQAISEAKEALLVHAQFVNCRGDFDRRTAAKDLYATGDYTASEAYDKARDMEQEWTRMFIEKASKIL